MLSIFPIFLSISNGKAIKCSPNFSGKVKWDYCTRMSFGADSEVSVITVGIAREEFDSEPEIDMLIFNE